MSGNEERHDDKEPLLFCEACGNTDWYSNEMYQSSRYYDADEAFASQSDIEYIHTTLWRCRACDARADTEQMEKLEEMFD